LNKFLNHPSLTQRGEGEWQRKKETWQALLVLLALLMYCLEAEKWGTMELPWLHIMGLDQL
jgi:hypothetical protein